MMYATLLEVVDVASDLRTRRALRDTAVLETAEATDKAMARMHKRRVKLLAAGKNVQLVRTAVAWDDPRRTTPRRQRRAFQQAIYSMMKRVRQPESAKERADEYVDRVFADKERRARSGLVVPGGRR